MYLQTQTNTYKIDKHKQTCTYKYKQTHTNMYKHKHVRINTKNKILKHETQNSMRAPTRRWLTAGGSRGLHQS